jgi:signal transduction histidine kinase
MEIKVEPAWWQLTSFRAALGAAAIGLLFGLHRFRMAQVERQRTERESFSRRLIESQEQTSQRIASELHDGLGQNLIVIKNRAALALTRMDPSRPEVAQVEEVSLMASAALQEVRTIAQNLRPYQIDQFGLTHAIESMSRKTAESSGIEIKCELENIDGMLPAGFEIGFYRIAQESVNNIAKHSKARRATLRTRREDRRVRLTVIDDGCGFVADPTGEKAGFGLRNMVERARAMRGELSIHSSPGQGTRVEVVVPTG